MSVLNILSIRICNLWFVYTYFPILVMLKESNTRSAFQKTKMIYVVFSRRHKIWTSTIHIGTD